MEIPLCEKFMTVVLQDQDVEGQSGEGWHGSLHNFQEFILRSNQACHSSQSCLLERLETISSTRALAEQMTCAHTTEH